MDIPKKRETLGWKRARLLAIVCLLLPFSAQITYAQQAPRKKRSLKLVEVPDSIKVKMSYVQDADDSEFKAFWVFNLINHQDYKYGNGIFYWKGMGPHYPRRLFIYHNGETYIFKSVGAFEPVEVLQEYLTAITKLKLSNDYVIKYSCAISQFLKQEEGATYGQEVK